MRPMKWMIAVAVLAGAMGAQAAPWLGLVKTGTTSQTSDTISLGTLTFSMDIRANTDGYKVQGLEYYIYTTPGDVVTYGTTPVTALNTPFVAADLTGFGHAPTAGAHVIPSSYTLWWNASGDYNAFGEQSIGTYQFNVSLLGAGTYVFTPDFSDYGAPGGQLSNSNGDNPTFGTPGSFALTVVPEPGPWTLLACGGFVAAWRNRRRNTH